MQVTLTRGSSIGQTELTRAAWLETGWGKPKRNIQISSADCLEPTCPVNNVSFFDAVRYANWLSEREGLPPCYVLSGCRGEVGLDLACTGVRLTSDSAHACAGCRLPAEAEWEYAARAGSISGNLLPNPSEIELRTVRGGGFAVPGDSCTAADRDGGARSFMSSSSVGFRLIRAAGPGK